MAGQPFGSRGELYVIGQFGLLVLTAAGPVQIDGWPALLPEHPLIGLLALASAAIGLVLIVAGGRRLGRLLTPLPHPVAASVLVEDGVYRLVRHPIYGGLMLLAFGWSLRRGGGLALIYAGLLAGWLAIKARAEERWLADRHPGYAAYRRRTRRFLPFLW